MRFEVLLTEDAVRDLEEIHEYLAEHDAPVKDLPHQDRVLDGSDPVPDPYRVERDGSPDRRGTHHFSSVRD